jgi:hypothetical protein
MLRKLLSLGALVVVAAAFFAGPASAAKQPGPPNNPGNFATEGFSDGRF